MAEDPGENQRRWVDLALLGLVLAVVILLGVDLATRVWDVGELATDGGAFGGGQVESNHSAGRRP